MHLRVAVRRTYSSGERDLERFSGRGQGMISRWERPISISGRVRGEDLDGFDVCE